MKSSVKFCAALAAALLAVPSWANKAVESQALAGPAPSAATLGMIERMIYAPDRVFEIRARVGSFVNIEVPPDERIEGFYLSDTTLWRFVVAKDQARVLVKPSVAGSTNSGTLVTSKRVYELAFLAVQDGAWHHKVQWDPAREERQAWGVFEPAFSSFGAHKTEAAASPPAPQGSSSARAQPAAAETDELMVDARRLHFAWSVQGQAPFRPASVFDDGTFTYIRLPKVQDLPALFAVDQGVMRLVDYVVRKDTLVVPRISEQFVLRLGQQAVTLVRHGQL